MAKKLLGERQLGEKVYTAGQILTEEEFAASGLSESDVTPVGDAPAPVAAQETAVAPADGDADVDTQEKNTAQESAPNGSEPEAPATGGEGGTDVVEDAPTVETVEHTLTEQDLIDNPELVAQGHKAGDVVRVPKEEPAA